MSVTRGAPPIAARAAPRCWATDRPCLHSRGTCPRATHSIARPRGFGPSSASAVEASSPHPRGSVTGVARAIDGRVLEAVEAVGKNLLLRFEGGVIVRSHLRMTGRWRVVPDRRGAAGRPWLVLRARRGRGDAVERPGAPLDAGGRAAARPRPARRRDRSRTSSRALRRADPTLASLGDVLVDQRLVAGIGNMWLAELLWQARLSPWLAARGRRRRASSRRARVGPRRRCAPRSAGARPARAVYRRAGRPCPRCGDAVASRGLGDDNRTAYWCPAASAARRRRRQRAEDRAPSAAYLSAWPFARRSSTTPCARSRSARSPISCASSTRRAPSFRSRSRSTSTARRPGALRVPAARARLRRGARRPAARPRRRACIALEELAARAGRRDLRACARGPRARPRTRRSSAPCSLDLLDPRRRGVRRLRLGRRVLRPRLRRARALALRRAAHVHRRSHRSSASPSRLQLELAPGLRVRAVADGELARHWPEAGALLPPGLRARARPLLRRSSSARRSTPARTSPDAPAEIADAVTAIRLATAAPLAAGPVLFETLDGRPVRHPAGAADRGDAAAGRADAARRVPRRPRRRAARAARARRRRHAPRRGARPLGALAVPARAVPLGAAARGARRAARRRRGRCARPCCSRSEPDERARAARRADATRGRRDGDARAQATPCGARSSRSLRARRPAGARRASSTRSCSAARRGPLATARRVSVDPRRPSAAPTLDGIACDA